MVWLRKRRGSWRLGADFSSGPVPPPPAGVPLSPDALSDLSAWYDMEDNATISIVNPGFANSIANKQPTTKDYTSGLATQEPAIVTVSGHQMFRFDGTTDVMGDVQSNAVVQPGSAGFTVVALARAPGASGGTIWFQGDSTAGPFWLLRFGNAVTNDIRLSVDDGPNAFVVSSQDETFADGTRWVIIGERDTSDSTIRLYYGNGTSLQETSNGATSVVGLGSLNAVNSQFGALLGPLSQFLGGDIGELLFYKRALSASERTFVWSYLVQKWGL